MSPRNMSNTYCVFDGCEKVAARRGWCHMHYKRWQVHGDPSVKIASTGGYPLVDERIKMQSVIDLVTGCQLWTGKLNHDGYARLRVDQRAQYVHRYLWERDNGPVPVGYELDHLCRNRNCVNRFHLEIVTHAENVGRGVSGRWQKEKTHCPKGHPYAGANLMLRPSGSRRCRACENASCLAAYHKRTK